MKKSLSVLSLTALIVFSCSRSAVPVTFADVCQKEDQTMVSIEGYLRLPTLMDATTSEATNLTSYGLLLAEMQNGKGATLVISALGTKSNERNRIAELPANYTYNDFRIITDQGAVIGANDRVRITGELSKGENNCRIVIRKIEATR